MKQMKHRIDIYLALMLGVSGAAPSLCARIWV